jgi:hypothetical protein
VRFKVAKKVKIKTLEILCENTKKKKHPDEIEDKRSRRSRKIGVKWR